MYAGEMHMGSDALADDSHGETSGGVCVAPSDGSASALVQHADMNKLCKYNPPFGFRALCREAGAVALLRSLANPRVCRYKSCAVVGSGGTLLGARLGKEIDAHEAVLRLNLAPGPKETAKWRYSPHTHLPTWISDLGARTTWRVMSMEGYGYLNHYGRFWLKPPRGHGRHDNMSGIPQKPLLAIVCHEPTTGTGRCRAERIRQTFGHQWTASYLLNPLLLSQWTQSHFRNVKNQRVPSTGMSAIAFASQLCGEVHLYGFGNGQCAESCYHYYDCGETAGGRVSGGTRQSNMFGADPKATGGYHNFSAQARVLHRLVAGKVVTAHWGTCQHSTGDAPVDEYRRGGKGRGGPNAAVRARRRQRRAAKRAGTS